MEDNQKNEWDAFPEVIPSSDTSDDFSDFPAVNQGTESGSATFGEKAAAFGETVAGGTVQGSGVIAGAGSGAALGSLAWPGIGTAIGAVVGGVAGGWVGGEARGDLGLRRPEEMPEELRPAAYSGEVIGESLPFAAAPMGAAMSGFRFSPAAQGLKAPSQSAKFLDSIIDTAKARPLRFSLAEARTVGISAAASGTVATIAPGQEQSRMWAEMLAPLPSEIALQTAKFGISKIQNVMRSMSPAGRQTIAAKQLQQLLDVTGEDPRIISKIIRDFEKEFPDIKELTMAQITGSKSLSAMEDWISKESKKFGAEVENAAREGAESIRVQIGLLTRTGDPEALRVAAELRQDYFRGLITARVESAKQIAAEKVVKISELRPENAIDISIAAREALDDAIKQSRKIESELWGEIDNTVPATIGNLKTTYDEMLQGMLPEEHGGDIPKVVTDFLKRLKGSADEGVGGFREFVDLEDITDVDVLDKVVATTGDLIKLRRLVLDEARKATKADDFGKARLLNSIAEATMDDIDNAFADAGDEAYDTARAFSKEFNDVFTRSFAGKATGQGKYGARIAPEILLTESTAVGSQAATVRMKQLEEATNFLTTRGFADDSNYKVMLDSQEEMLRMAAARAIDSQTGRISVKKLQTFMNKPGNAVMMKRFPEVKQTLTEAIKSETALKDMELLAKNQNKIMENKSVFKNFIKKDPVASARSALLDNNQERSIGDFVKSIKYTSNFVPANQKQQIIDGGLQSLFDATIQLSTKDVRSAGQVTRSIDMGLFKSFLFESSVPGKKAPIEMLLDEKMITPAHKKNIEKLLDLADNIQKSGIGGTAFEVKKDIGDAAITLLSRLLGSGTVGAATKATGVGGHSIIIHGAAARFAEEVVGKMPLKSSQRVWEEALTNPKELADLLKKTTSPEDSVKKMRKINAWFIRSGIYTVGNEMDRFIPEQADDEGVQP